ncbi:hypothetical protein NPIL_321761 [Nephila pilipes]|uniref:Uncharacterized protein n=1 Tax=Nephila pilipes TaxID=299642 RepID=A0A8X6TVK3_NEPPI|nr:hypothetical protein NPIL_321761 [Nephila pilipes]
MIIAMIFAACLHVFHCALRVFVGFLDLLYFIEVIIFDSMIEFIDNSAAEFLDRVVFGHENTTTADAALIPFPSVQKTCEALESKLVPPQETATLTDPPNERKDQVATVPVVRSFFVFKMCEAFDLPATFVPQESFTELSCKYFKVNRPAPIVYSVTVFEMCKALKLEAQLAHQ